MPATTLPDDVDFRSNVIAVLESLAFRLAMIEEAKPIHSTTLAGFREDFRIAMGRLGGRVYYDEATDTEVCPTCKCRIPRSLGESHRLIHLPTVEANE